MSDLIIRRILESRLNTWASGRSPALSINWENTVFDAPSTTYLRFFLLPAQTQSQDEQGAHRGYSGSYQVSIVAMKGTGSAEAIGIAEEIQTLFHDSLVLTESNFTLTLTSPVSIGPAIQEADRFTIPAFGFYKSDTF